MKSGRRAALLLALVCAGCGDGADEKPVELLVAVAASLTDVVQEVGDRFATDRDVEIVYNFAGSGALAQQLIAAPRADVFLSASEHWMDEVESAGLLVPGTRASLVSNSLVIIANRGSSLALDDAAGLCEAEFRYLSLGDPESVPAGRYARRWLETTPCPEGGDAWTAVRDRVAPAPDSRAALNQVLGSRELVGIVYRTDYIARAREVRLLHEAGDAEGPTIRFPVAVLSASRTPALAREFVDFLSSPAAARVFDRHGFRPIRRS